MNKSGNTFFRLPMLSLWKREMVRFFRQRNRVFGALVQPLIFWLLFGIGFSGSLNIPGAPSDMTAVEFFYPGIIAMILLFTAIFATVSIIEDRNEGFLQSVLVAPVPRAAIVAGKVLGGASIAVIQGCLFLLLAPFAGISMTLVGFFIVVMMMIIISLSLTSIGLCLSWRMTSIQGFHAIMMVFLMPMWLLSGAFFPVGGVPIYLRWIIYLNPLTYGVAALRHGFYAGHPAALSGVPGFGLSVLLSVGFFVVAYIAAVQIARK